MYNKNVETLLKNLLDFCNEDTKNKGTSTSNIDILASLKSACSDCEGGDFEKIIGDINAIAGYWEELRDQVKARHTEIETRAQNAEDYYTDLTNKIGTVATSSKNGTSLTLESNTQNTYGDYKANITISYFYKYGEVTINESDGSITINYHCYCKKSGTYNSKEDGSGIDISVNSESRESVLDVEDKIPLGDFVE